MSEYLDYYDNFYRDLAKIDAAGNSFAKIDGFIPDLPPGAKILDVGAGYGSVSCELIERGYEVWALEGNTEAVEILKGKGFHAVLQDISQSIQLPDRFHLILLLDVLEHVFDPVRLLVQARSQLAAGGKVVISIPLYFDIIDRLRILFTGTIISYDNRCYGPDLYSRFRSYNYDHIRFFRPKEIPEMARLAGLAVERLEYSGMPIPWRLPRLFASFMTSRRIVQRWPQLFAHSARAILVENR